MSADRAVPQPLTFNMSPTKPKLVALLFAALLLFAIAGAKSAGAAPAFQAAGAAVSGTGAVSPAWPAHQAGDIALLFVESAGGQAATLSVPAGFAPVAGSPQATGATTTGTRLTVFWARATSAAMAAPTVADPGDHVYARILTYRGAIATGDPWDATGGGVRDNTVTLTGLTTSVANTRIVQAVTRETDSTAASFSAQANPSLSGIAERSDGGTTSGDGGGFAVWDGVKATAGPTGDTTATVAAPSFNSFLTIALRPQGGSAPTYQAAGTAVSGTGVVNPPWPAHAVNDIALLFVESRGAQAATLSIPAGFAPVANSPQSTTAGGTGTRLTVFWARATSSGMATPRVADPGDHVYARIITYRGVATSGDPWDAAAGGVRDGTLTLGGITTSVADTLVVQAASRDNDSTAVAFSAQANPNLSAIAERSDGGTTSGNGGGFAVWDGVMATAGATGNTTATVAVASVNAYLSIALKKRPYPIVTAIARASPDPTSPATTVSWTVTFSDDVTGVDATDFLLTPGGGVAGASITGVTGGGTTWTVTASTGTGAGTLGLDLVDDDTIIDAGLVPLGGAGAGNGNLSGEVYTVLFTSSGFVFTSSSCTHNIALGAPGQCSLVNWSPQIAGQALAGVYITAVNTSGVPTRLHATQVRTRNLQFGLSCHDPAAHAGVQAVFAGATLPLCQSGGAAPASWSVAVTVTFPGGSPSSNVSYAFGYADVGRVELWVRNSAATAQVGTSGAFVVKPGGFALSSIRQTAPPNLANPAAADAAGAKFVKAGEAFSVTVTATTIDGATAVPNYGRETAPEGVLLAATLVAPSGGASPALLNASAFGAFASGVATGTTFSWGEVGIVTLTPSVGDGNYLGAGDTTGAVSGNVGRFYPDHFDLTPEASDSLIDRAGINTGATESCASPFSYLGEDFKTRFVLSARNAANAVTQNYTGGFAKLGLGTWGNFGFSAGGLPAGSTLGAGGTAPSGTWNNGTAQVTAHHKASRPATPVAPGTSVTVNALPVDGDGVTLPAAVQTHAGATALRYGRLRLSNVYGSAAPLSMPVEAQYWSNVSWVRNADDNCTPLAAANLLLTPAGWTVSAPGTLAGGAGNILLTPTGPGSAAVCADLGADNGVSCAATGANLPWLQSRWPGGSGYDNDPTATATFGIFSPEGRKGIYNRELY